MAKRKRDLKKEKANPNSRYWRKKADVVWSDRVRAIGVCEVTGKEGLPRADGMMVKGLEAHHLINRQRYKFRHDLNNGVCLSVSVHGSLPNFRNHKISAHGSLDAMEAFLDKLKELKPEQWEWYLEHKQDKRPPELSYQEQYELLIS